MRTNILFFMINLNRNNSASSAHPAVYSIMANIFVFSANIYYQQKLEDNTQNGHRAHKGLL